MSMRIKSMALLVWLVACTVYGVFTPPLKDQLKEAAKDPSLVVAMLQDATAPQAAEVAKDVIIQIVELNLKDAERDARIASLTSYLFLAWPESNWADLAIALGRAVAASPTASMSAATISATQQGIMTVADVKIGNAFGNA